MTISIFFNAKRIHVCDCIVFIPDITYSHQKNLRHHHIQESGTLISRSGCFLPLLSPAMSAGSVARLVTCPKTVATAAVKEGARRKGHKEGVCQSLLFSFSSLLSLSLSCSYKLPAH